MAKLLKKLAFVFGQSIDNPCLRQATLALAAALSPSSQIHHGLIDVYCNGAYCALRGKKGETITEADLFATLLLALVSCVLGDFDTFRTHIKGFMVIAHELSQNVSKDKYRPMLSVFWPLARDLLFESSRTFLRASSVVVEFYTACRLLLGPQNILSRADYLAAIYGYDPEYGCAFLHAAWQHSTALRICFRRALCRQLQGSQYVDLTIESVLSEAKADLSSPVTSAIVACIFTHHSGGLQLSLSHDLMMYALVLHQFCQLLITLLEAKTLVDGARSLRAREYALTILGLMRPEWTQEKMALPSIFPRNISPFLVPRILCIAGLALNANDFMDGTVIC